ncbi:MAG: 2-amino-4-hydroxy-6-hydroxymethyldihydropteridine diphosphokinase [Acidimicrobiaceae bacterium]|nr:2-amino-4-hydroxy-6-hydroxymethyldihydropteridine diphosphokinase [Acidimicrobiaceae bacterium]
MARTYLALGSNLGNRIEYLRQAVCSIPGQVRCSRVYETEPIQAPEGSGPFLNAVVGFDYAADKRALLDLVHELELQAKRERNQINGPRTLDVDVIYVEGMFSIDPLMTVPHPRCAERAFVIAPLFELDPELAGQLNRKMAEEIGLALNQQLSCPYPGVWIYSESIC